MPTEVPLKSIPRPVIRFTINEDFALFIRAAEIKTAYPWCEEILNNLLDNFNNKNRDAESRERLSDTIDRIIMMEADIILKNYLKFKDKYREDSESEDSEDELNQFGNKLNLCCVNFQWSHQYQWPQKAKNREELLKIMQETPQSIKNIETTKLRKAVKKAINQAKDLRHYPDNSFDELKTKLRMDRIKVEEALETPDNDLIKDHLLTLKATIKTFIEQADHHKVEALGRRKRRRLK